jgi:hypothetical protein
LVVAGRGGAPGNLYIDFLPPGQRSILPNWLPNLRVLGELFKAEISEKQARSIRYQLGVAKLPLAKELGDFVFADTPINEAGRHGTPLRLMRAAATKE